MIDRSQMIFPLRRQTLIAAAAISAGLFALLLVVWLLCQTVGWIAFGICWLIILICFLALYGLVLVVGLGVGGAFLAGASQSKDKGGGCLVVLGLGIGFAIISNGFTWVEPRFNSAKASLSQTGDAIQTNCAAGASTVYNDIFLGYRVHLWSWSVLATALCVAGLTLGTIALGRSESLVKYSLFGIAYACPKCGRRGQPLFRCASCGKVHDDLRPTAYGVWQARCGYCQADLPVTDLTGRLRLEKVCADPACSHDLTAHGFGTQTEVHIAVVGAQSSGKSNLMVAAVAQLKNVFARRHGIGVKFANKTQEHEFRSYVELFRRGERVPKTVSTTRPMAFNLSLKPREGAGALLYLYDAAGEDFEAGELAYGASAHGLSGHNFSEYVSGAVFVVDPFGEEGGARLAGAHGVSVAPARIDAGFVLGKLLPHWMRSLHVSADGWVPIPVAVVVTKADACGLASRLTASVSSSVYPSFAAAAAATESNSTTVREFLLGIGAEEFVTHVESHFRQVRYFGVSALGRSYDPKDTTAFRPYCASDPFIWLAYRTNALSDAPSVTQPALQFRAFLLRCLCGQEGRSARVASGILLASAIVTFMYGLWWLGGVWLALSCVAVVSVGPLAWRRYQAHGTADIYYARQVLERTGHQYCDALQGRMGQHARRKAGLWTVVAVGFLAACWYVWIPLGISTTLAVGLVALLVWRMPRHSPHR